MKRETTLAEKNVALDERHVREAQESVSRPLHWRDQRREGHCADVRDPPVDDAADKNGAHALTLPPAESMNQRHRREITEQEERFARASTRGTRLPDRHPATHGR